MLLKSKNNIIKLEIVRVLKAAFSGESFYKRKKSKLFNSFGIRRILRISVKNRKMDSAMRLYQAGFFGKNLKIKQFDVVGHFLKEGIDRQSFYNASNRRKKVNQYYNTFCSRIHVFFFKIISKRLLRLKSALKSPVRITGRFLDFNSELSIRS